jgi:hypothetical protein
METHSALQIYSVEKTSENTGICVVRCIAGRVRLGDIFTSELPSSAPVTRLHIDKIERYSDVFVERFDPPHAARVYFSGPGAQSLERGHILTAAKIVSDSPTD